jgi:two-component system, NarL family, nitrate/nitrite response regulator NarL
MTLPPPNREQIRVLLVDCTKMACELLADAIAHEPSITVVGAVTTAAEAYQVLKHESPDIVLLSERLNGELTGGFQLARQLRGARRQLLFIMLLDSLNSGSVVEAFRAGASGVFTRDGSLESLRKCIATVVRGEVWASSEALRFLIAALSSASMPSVDPNRMALLTKRECEVVSLAADSVKNREIALRLGISGHTVKNYLFSIFRKLGVGSRVELTLALRQDRIGKKDFTPIQHHGTHAGAKIFQSLGASADKGVASTQRLLAQMYRDGLGVPCDQTEAYRLLLLAVNSAQIAEVSRSARKKLAGEMSAMRIAEDESLAAIWLEESKKETKPFAAAKSSR